MARGTERGAWLDFTEDTRATENFSACSLSSGERVRVRAVVSLILLSLFSRGDTKKKWIG